ncbi:MAG: hypothetical protein DBY08_06080 [Clostridiales bacterium]|nr:DUF3842 family protein [Bacillota bacterium]MEE0517843.1 DUF3842 family protein [Anaerovoracaceae bacterium]PWL92936.1 MAG: hypothetical protein DBY08_06080 [Clostridiales bacterium]
MNKILIIDGQGGLLGKQLVETIRKLIPEAEITAVGTNPTATTNMLKAGAANGATGENAVKVCARSADIIVGPIGIAIADSLLGEITPDMAVAIGQSNAKKVLIPINKCNNIIAGTGDKSTSELITDAIDKISKLIRR